MRGSVARCLAAMILMGGALVALVIDNMNQGWTVLGGVGVAGFVLGIASSFGALRRARLHS